MFNLLKGSRLYFSKIPNRPIKRNLLPGFIIFICSGVLTYEMVEYFKTSKENPFVYGYYRMKKNKPIYSYILEEVNKRDFEQQPLFTKSDNSNNINETDIREKMEKLVRRVQHRISLAYSALEGKSLKEELWKKPDNKGGGVVMSIQDGKYIEKGGINYTISRGKLSKESQRKLLKKDDKIYEYLKYKDEEIPLFSASISSVIHPCNPHAPSVHFNYRYFELGEYDDNNKFIPKFWWFGGGADLSPSIIYSEDFKHFHLVYKNICEKFKKGSYSIYKKWCDDYFYIPYRKEHRGVGGIFFDNLNGPNREKVFEFISELANAHIEAYFPILLKRCRDKFSREERNWQLIRRGRYAEFNLAIDKGTMYGISKKNSNVEAIHISLPLNARFVYDYKTDNKAELELLKVLKEPVDWIPLS